MGQPIEEEATKAVTINSARREAGLEELPADGANPVDHYAGEALKATTVTLTPAQLFMLAQKKFISAQTAFIHNPKNLQIMLDAQSEFLGELAEYIGSQDMGAILSLQEGYVTELLQLIDQRSMF